jgi:hypothetical protein
MRSWDSTRSIVAEDLRDLLRPATRPDSHRLRPARIASPRCPHSKPALYADEPRTDARVSFEESTLLTSTADGAMRMIGAHIGGGHLDCSGATIRDSSGPRYGPGAAFR